jgi:hypothetical protein
MLIVASVFLFCGLVLPAPQNDVELNLHDPSSAMVIGAHQAQVGLKQAPQRLISFVVRVLGWIVGILTTFVVVARRRDREEGWSVSSRLRGASELRRGPPLTI